MNTVLGRLSRALPAATTLLVLGACSGNTASPTATGVSVTSVVAEQQPTSSITVQGTVTDAANRPIAGAEVECMGGVQCVPFGAQVIQEDGPDDGVKTNAAGAYTLVVKRAGGSAEFLMNAAARGYEPSVHPVAFPDPACNSDRAGCTVTLSFTLTARAD